MRGKKKELQGLEQLGSRLKELRVSAGISQMKLAELLGLNPTHGYKYILRLEKGLIPNPTVRTITGFLAACGATWNDIADVLPALGLKPHREEPPHSSEPVVISPAQASNLTVSSSAPAPTKDSTAKLFSEDYWRRVKTALDRISDRLRLSHQGGVQRRAYFTFVRSVCATIFQFQNDPKSLNTALERIFGLASRQGLNLKILNQTVQICREVFGLNNN
ncbi:MAG: helix-turn-helix domain-containing protein [bacterium]